MMETVFDQIQCESYGSNCQYRYKNADFVGRGRFGTVYEATVRGRYRLFGGRLMVVKVFHLSKDKKPLISLENWMKWRNRMKALLDLDHKNLVAYHKLTIFKLRDAACVELLMEYCRGGDLAVFLQRLTGNKALLDERTATRYALDIAEGLNYLHQKNIIHGDLKPSNVVVKQVASGEDSLAICDLDDFIQMQGNQTCTDDMSQLRGTYRYMSPEMLRTFVDPPTEERPGRKTDVWSLGCIILALAERVVGISERWLQKDQTAVPAGDNISDNGYIMKVMDGFIPVCHESIPQKLKLCIQRCLCERSTERCTALEVVNDLKVTPTDTASAASTQKASTSAEETSAPLRIICQLADVGKKLLNAGKTSGTPVVQLATGGIINATFGSGCRYHFRPQDYIGRGSFGIVHAGMVAHRGDYRGESRVAIKVAHMSMSELEVSFDLEGWKQQCGWWKRLCGLRHSNLLAYHKITVAEVRTGAIVEQMMDYYDGGTLASMLLGLKRTGAALDEAGALNFATQTTDGLEFLHRNNVIHANLTPAKVLLKRMNSGQKSLVIGGLDDATESSTCSRDTNIRMMSRYAHAYRYMSPEMLRKFMHQDQVVVGRKTDVWSLGCIILQLANTVAGSDQMCRFRKGEKTIETGDNNIVFRSRYIEYIMDGYVPLAANSAPHSLVDCVMHCLTFSSSERISAAGLLEKLQNFAPIS